MPALNNTNASTFIKLMPTTAGAACLLQKVVTLYCLQALDPCISCLDLLLRWCVLRLADGNTQTLVSVTGMLKASHKHVSRGLGLH